MVFTYGTGGVPKKHRHFDRLTLAPFARASLDSSRRKIRSGGAVLQTVGETSSETTNARLTRPLTLSGSFVGAGLLIEEDWTMPTKAPTKATTPTKTTPAQTKVQGRSATAPGKRAGKAAAAKSVSTKTISKPVSKTVSKSSAKAESAGSAAEARRRMILAAAARQRAAAAEKGGPLVATPPVEEALEPHRFEVGQTVRVVSAAGMWFKNGTTFVITAALPPTAGRLQYRVRNSAEPFERVVAETQIEVTAG